MEFGEAVRKSITVFYEGKLPKKTISMSETDIKYTPEYFDTLEEELAGDTDNKSKEKEEDLDVDK